MVTGDGLRARLRDFERGVELADGHRSDRRVMVTVLCCALEDAARARNLVRRHLAFYVAAMGTYYRDALARQGYTELADEIATTWQAGDRDAAVAAIPDTLIDEVGAAGTPSRARDRLAQFEAIEGVDTVSVSFPRGISSAEIHATLDAVAP